MLFNSYIFILAFLPLTIIGYFVLNSFGKTVAAKIFLLGMSFWFYGYFRVSYLLLLAGSIVVNYLIYLLLTKKGLTAGKKKTVMILGLVLNLGTLGYFKYLDFLLGGINEIFGASIPLPEILLPLGISFFTFQQVGFVIDAYRGETGNYRFLDYALFVSFFPQLVAGPIVTHGELIPQLSDMGRKRINARNMSAGIVGFVLGLSKKILLADVFARVADYAWSTAEMLSPADTAIAIIAYYFQIYFDFSGYSDMAIGLGRMLNLDLPVNFDSPYKALTIREYWKRWHMTLTGFLTKYLYIPMGGSRKGKLRTYVNTLIVFLISGIWHGAGTGYIFWGLLGGIGIVFCRILEKPIEKMERFIPARVVMWILNMIYISLGWVFFRGESFSAGAAFLKHLIPFGDHTNLSPVSSYLLPMFKTAELEYLLKLLHLPVQSAGGLILGAGYIAAAMIIILLAPNVKKITEGIRTEGRGIKAPAAIGAAVLFVWCFVSLSGISTYIYYNF